MISQTQEIFKINMHSFYSYINTLMNDGAIQPPLGVFNNHGPLLVGLLLEHAY